MARRTTRKRVVGSDLRVGKRAHASAAIEKNSLTLTRVQHSTSSAGSSSFSCTKNADEQRKKEGTVSPLSRNSNSNPREVHHSGPSHMLGKTTCRPSILSVSTDTDRHRADLSHPEKSHSPDLSASGPCATRDCSSKAIGAPPLYRPNLLSPIHSEVDVGGAQVVDVKPYIFWKTVPDQVLVLVLVFAHVQHMPVWESRRTTKHFEWKFGNFGLTIQNHSR